jgi:hypothetical protein
MPSDPIDFSRFAERARVSLAETKSEIARIAQHRFAPGNALIAANDDSGPYDQPAAASMRIDPLAQPGILAPLEF